MNHYIYEGPVMEFNQCIIRHWSGATYANSEKKAKNNLAYQFKKKFNRLPNAKIVLPGTIEIID